MNKKTKTLFMTWLRFTCAPTVTKFWNQH